MSNPTTLYFDADALLHNVQQVKFFAPHQKIIAMVKANAYGCGIQKVLPILKPHVDAFGVSCVDEAARIRQLSHDCRCILFHGIYNPTELEIVSRLQLECVIHQPIQVEWILNHPMPAPIKVWVKINTGMNRLGLDVEKVSEVMSALLACPWVSQDIGLMTHLACADEPEQPRNQKQIDGFNQIASIYPTCKTSMANSAAIMALPTARADVVRPGIMLYGISPFAQKLGIDLGLKPVMRLTTKIAAIHAYPANSPIGYGGIWQSDKPSLIGVIPLGYGDGYPRHICKGTSVWFEGIEVPIVGRVSMDLITIDLSQCPEARLGDTVELWGPNMPIERVAQSAGTIAYELICQITQRVTRD